MPGARSGSVCRGGPVAWGRGRGTETKAAGKAAAITSTTAGKTGTGGKATMRAAATCGRAGATAISTVSIEKAEPLRSATGAAPGASAERATVKTSSNAQRRPARRKGKRLSTLSI